MEPHPPGRGSPGGQIESRKERAMMAALLRKLVKDESAQDLAEYAIALAVITIAVILTVQAVGSSVNKVWSQANSTLDTAAS
jgi:Flp pilus assembly pilin Flp